MVNSESVVVAPPSSQQHPVFWHADTRVLVFKVLLLTHYSQYFRLYLHPSKVENTLYSLPLAVFLMASPILNDLFSIPVAPPTDGSPPEGTVENPVVIEDVAAIAFEDLAGFLLPCVSLDSPL